MYLYCLYSLGFFFKYRFWVDQFLQFACLFENTIKGSLKYHRNVIFNQLEKKKGHFKNLTLLTSLFSTIFPCVVSSLSYYFFTHWGKNRVKRISYDSNIYFLFQGATSA